MTLVQCRHCRCCSSWCTLHFLDGNLVSFQCLSILLLCCMTRCEHVFDGPERIIVSHFGRNRVVLKCALVVPIPTLVIAQRVPRPGAPMHRGHFPMLDALSLVLCYSVPSVIELAKGLTSFGRSTFCCFCQQLNCSRQILFEPVPTMVILQPKELNSFRILGVHARLYLSKNRCIVCCHGRSTE